MLQHPIQAIATHTRDPEVQDHGTRRLHDRKIKRRALQRLRPARPSLLPLRHGHAPAAPRQRRGPAPPARQPSPAAKAHPAA